MLLGRPWFRTAKLKQDWGKNQIQIKLGRQKVVLPMVSKVKLKPSHRPLWAQTISLATEVEDLEEEEYLRSNPSVVPIFEVDVMSIVAEYEMEASSQGEIGKVLTKETLMEMEKEQLSRSQDKQKISPKEAIAAWQRLSMRNKWLRTQGVLRRKLKNLIWAQKRSHRW